MKLQDDTVGLNAAREVEPPDTRRIPVRFEARDIFIEVRTGETSEHLLTIVATDHGLLI